MLAIRNCKFFREGILVIDEVILIEKGTIAGYSPLDQINDYPVIDAEGAYVTPGLLDLQIYGSGGNLFSAYPTIDTLQQMDEDLIGKGTTGFLACVATNSTQIVNDSIAAAKLYMKHANGFLGLHLEGPYINRKRRGAHVEKYIKKATVDEVRRIIEDADGVIKMMTIAAELQDEEVLDYLAETGIVLSLGHSDSNFEQANDAFRRGFTTTTHLFNAMPSIHHRSPNLPGAVLNHSDAMASIIADGQHVSFEMVKLSYKAMRERLFLITDAVTSCNVGPYQHQLSGDKFITPDGTLSGSNITLLEAVRNCVKECGIPLDDALDMATKNPSKLMGISNKLGTLSVGSVANLLLLGDDLRLRKVFVHGAEHLSIKN
ncbi:MAG: N-acetylglucosamine-6-phosphate deacetylase [Pedobacter sp.]|nr:MAG: N-acetylglucosamine-6-phosphate deacetylase [Pedobacter sp.]